MTSAPPTDAPEAAPALPSWRVERVCLDEAGLLVVDKPAGVPVHGGDESVRHSLVDRIGDWLEASGRPPYLGVHSRLDQGTSGLLLFTTSPDRNEEVARASERHEIRRVYQALVRREPGARLAASGRVELQLEHQRGKTEVVRRGGKRAVTRYRVLEEQGPYALVELELETGRTHQIRVSLAHLGAPLVGDALYGGEPAERLFLHAVELSGGPLPKAIRSELPSSFSFSLGRSTGPSARLDFSRREIAVPREERDVSARLLDALSRRAPLTEGSSAFRLVNGEGDELPGLVIDGYGPFVAVSIYDEAWTQWLPLFAAILKEQGYRGGYVKTRVRADLRAEDQRELAPELPFFGEAAPEELVVHEHGLRIAIHLGEGLSTGLFVDQRDNRRRVAGWAAGGRVLNLFSYTSSFSVAAALAGARTVSVDLSGRALARARRNFELSGLPEAEHRFFKEDAMKYLERAVRRGERYELVILDPPSFATVGKGTFHVRGRYEEAAAHCVQLLAPGGRLLGVTNHQKTPLEAFRRMLRDAARAAGRGVVSLKDLPPGLDCPEASSGPWPSKSLLLTVS